MRVALLAVGMTAIKEIATHVGADRYELDELISAGLDAHVWRASDRSHASAVVLKIVTRPRRFDGSVIEMTRLDHPNLVRVHHHGELDDGRPYVVLEVIEGVQLRRIMAGPIRPLDVLLILDQLADALRFIHDHGCAHGAVTPEHVMLSDGAANWCTVRLLGLGTS